MCLAGALGCTGPEPAVDLDVPVEPGTVPAELAASLEVVVEGDSVRLTLHLTNTTAAPLALRYPTAQRYEFVVRQGEAEVWRWSEGRMFAQVLTTDTIGAGETVSYREVWAAAGRSGVHTAEGRLLATERPVHLETELEVG